MNAFLCHISMQLTNKTYLEFIVVVSLNEANSTKENLACIFPKLQN